MTIKNDLKNYTVNPLYLIFDKVNGFFKEINGNKYLTLLFTKKAKKKNMNNNGVNRRFN